jgi:hypothetical protein
MYLNKILTTSFNMLKEKIFSSPAVEYRGMPFWSLNDRLEPEEMIRQVEEFHRAGMGGFFLHSRIGLTTEYLGKEWMDALHAAIERAGELGMQAWLYDEDKWPSGFAGGIIPLQNPEFRGRYLGRVAKEKDLPEHAESIYSNEGWNYFTATVPLGITDFNGTCYTDLMNPDVVKAYIQSTHEKYKKEFGQYFGNVIPGIFTDEPLIQMRPEWLSSGFNYLPYSPCLLERYQKTYSESPFLHLKELFEDTENSEKYRYRYFRMATEQFVEAFTKQLGEWCEQNNLKLTGHFMLEDTVELQTRWIGKAMPHYEHMQIPGIDHLALNINNILTAKQCSSVAHQQGKKEVLSEMFGCCGQNMTFEDRKWIAGWHGIMGINFVCHHLSLYSIRGCRKRDYPPMFSWHQPYWEDNSLIEDWQARFSYLLREGKYQADFLIIHPAESGWCLQKGNEASRQMREIDENIKVISQEMFRIHRDFDFGDEDYLARYADVNSSRLCAGNMSYGAVIIPSMLTMRKSTLELLKRFNKAGGIIIACGKSPRLIDGEYSKTIETLENISDFHITDITELKNTLDNACRSELKITGKNTEKVFIRRQKTDDGQLLILFNSSRLDSAVVDITHNCIELFLDNGEESAVKENSLTLAPTQTRVLLLKGERKTELHPAEKVNNGEINIGGPWQIECKDLNTLPLDFAEWSIDGGASWQEAEPVIALKTRLDNEKYSGTIELRYSFINNNCLGKVLFAAEIGMDDRLLVNGHKVDIEKDWFLDKCILKTDISRRLISGKNIIEVARNYVYANPACYDEPAKRYGTELETAFIVGDFGVYGKSAEVTELPKQASHDIWPDDLPKRRIIRLLRPYIDNRMNHSDGELTLSGLPFYAGTVVMTTEFELPSAKSCVLSLEYLDAITAKFFVNGKAVPEILSSRPFNVDISSSVKPGKNKLSIETKNSLRNLLGPHHHTLGELAGVGPYAFISRDFEIGEFAPKQNWSLPQNRCRQISWSDDYFIVRFGLGSSINVLYE